MSTAIDILESPLRIRQQWFIALPAMLLPGIASLFYFVWFKDSLLSQGVYFLTKIFTLVFPMIALRFFPWRKSSSWNLKTNLQSGGIGLVVGAIIFGLMLFLTKTPLYGVIQSGTTAIAEKSVQLGVYGHFWLFAAFISIAHSLLEEYYWRWFVYGQCCRKIFNSQAAAWLASLAFGFHHFVITIQYFDWFWGVLFGMAVVIAGYIWCWMYESQKSILGSWISHIFADLAIMFVGYQLLFK